MQRREIGSTGVMPTILGFGGASVGNLHRPVAADDACDAILAAHAGGVGFFDTAPLYGAGLGEQRIGDALATLPADSLVLSTKVGNGPEQTGGPVRFDYGYDATLRSMEHSLRRLGRTAIDIVFIHDIDPYNHGPAQPAVFRAAMDGAWRALETLRDAGVVRAIGVGVNDPAVCEACLRAVDVDCFLLAARYTLLDQSALASLLPACVARGVGVVLGAPFNSGLLARGAASAGTFNHRAPPPDVRSRVEAIEVVAAAHGVTLAAAALQFPLAHPAIVAVLPGPRSGAQMQACLEGASAPIPAAFWMELRHAKLINPAAPTPAAEYRTEPRLVTVADIDDFARLTGDHHLLHTDDAFARSMGFRSRIGHGLLGLSLMEGIKTGLRLYEHTSVASLGWNSVRFVRPLFPGESVLVVVRFTAKRLSRRPDRGVVTEAVSLVDPTGATLTEAEHVTLLLCR